jgi:hypothetical protein
MLKMKSEIMFFCPSEQAGPGQEFLFKIPGFLISADPVEPNLMFRCFLNKGHDNCMTIKMYEKRTFVG